MSITVSLNDNWKMKKAGSQESFDCKVPCSVYKTLLDYKKIPDPYYRENEYISTQICDDDYDFETTFTADKAAVECEHTVLHSCPWYHQRGGQHSHSENNLAKQIHKRNGRKTSPLGR